MRASLFLVAVIIFSCTNAHKQPDQSISMTPAAVTKTEPILILTPATPDTCCRKYDSVFSLFRAQRIELKIARYKLVKAKYYLDIIDGHPEREKYIEGWLRNRALQSFKNPPKK